MWCNETAKPLFCICQSVVGQIIFDHHGCLLAVNVMYVGDHEGEPADVGARQQAVMKAAELHKKFQEIVQWEAGKVCVCVCVCVFMCATADALRSAVSRTLQGAKPPNPNLSCQQHLHIQALRTDESMEILPANKGRVPIIVDSGDYQSKMRAILDEDKYRVLSQDPSLQFEKKIDSLLKAIHRDRFIDKKLCGQIPLPRYSDPP